MNGKNSDPRGFLRSRWGIGFLVFLGVAFVLLIFDHWAHIVESNLILAGVLLACGAMHLFMHGGHGGHGGSDRGSG